MRNFKTSPFGDIVDLDDSDTYNHLPDNTKQLDNLMFKEIGYALVYMNYFHKENFDKYPSQKESVHKLIDFFSKNRVLNYHNILWYQEQIFLFQNETENMC